MSVDLVKAKVQRILTEAEGSVRIDADGDFIVRFDSAVVYVGVTAGESATFVRTWAIVLSDIPVSDEVYRWAATEGQDFLFGRAMVHTQENGLLRIVMSHVLLGDFLDAEELKWATYALGGTADRLDDQLKTRFGGKRFVEE